METFYSLSCPLTAPANAAATWLSATSEHVEMSTGMKDRGKRLTEGAWVLLDLSDGESIGSVSSGIGSDTSLVRTCTAS